MPRKVTRPSRRLTPTVELFERRINLDAYIDIEGVHVDITIPQYNDQGELVGYTNFSYGPTGALIGGPGDVTVTPYGLDYDPDVHHDYAIDTTPYQDRLMDQYARQVAEDPYNYNLLSGSTCVGFTCDVLDVADIDGPWYTFDPSSGYGFDDWLEDFIPGVRPLRDQDIEGTGSSTLDDSSGGTSGNDSGSSDNEGSSRG